MLIPSIDLQNGQAVQLRQGKDLVLTAEQNPIELAKTFNRYGEVAVIDLDAAMGTGDNLSLIQEICQVASVRVGGGIRDVERARKLLRAGAQKLIVGTAATPELLSKLPKERVMVALDHLNSGEVVDHGWAKGTGESLLDRANRLKDYCSGFLCTFVEQEGCLGGMPIEAVRQLKATLPHPITVAGGIASTEDATAVCKEDVDVQVGMALYTGKLDPVRVVVSSLDFDKYPDGLIPTVVQDRATGTVRMLAYSSKESLTEALGTGLGVYYSRSRKSLWRKGDTSGHTQELISCRSDCDRDALLFTVIQNGPTCHTGNDSCFSAGFGPTNFHIESLFKTLQQRKADLPEGSYSAMLFQNRDKLLKKLMEEAFEVCVFRDKANLTWEMADLLYFMSLLAVDEGISWQAIQQELGGRHG